MTTRQAPNDAICPRCGRVNDCYNVVIKNAAERDKTDLQTSGAAAKQEPLNAQMSCWCNTIKLTSEQRQAVSAYGNGMCCICKACISEIQAS